MIPLDGNARSIGANNVCIVHWLVRCRLRLGELTGIPLHQAQLGTIHRGSGGGESNLLGRQQHKPAGHSEQPLRSRGAPQAGHCGAVAATAAPCK
eukprot:scaffold111_cov404-Prasinococcus_capsulatus_cf.AAC.8